MEDYQRIESPNISSHPDEPAPPYSEFDDGSSIYSSRDTRSHDFHQPSSNATSRRSQNNLLHPGDRRVRETALLEPSREDRPLHTAISYTTLNESIDAASNRFASTDTLIPRGRPTVPTELAAERPGDSESTNATVYQENYETDRPRRSSEVLPYGSAVRIVEPNSPPGTVGSDEQPLGIRNNGFNNSTQPSLSELEWQQFIQKGTVLRDDFNGDILEFQDATGRIHPLPFDRCSASFNNLVAAIHSRFLLMLKNPESLLKIEKAFKAAYSDVFFYKADYRQLRGEPGREFDISPVRWPREAQPNMRICIQFNSYRLDSRFGLQMWRDMYPNEVPKSAKAGKLSKFFSRG